MNVAPQPPAVPVLSLTQAQALTAFRSFLMGTLLPNVQVVRAQDNRVPEPLQGDFVVMTPIRQTRLSTNETTYADNVVIGSIIGTTLTVTTVLKGGPIAVGNLILDTTGDIASGTVVTAFGTGTGGVGAYTVSKSQTLTSEDLYLGQRLDLVPTELTVQLDIHGPSSADNTKVIEGLFRSEYSVDVMGAINANVVPLYCDEARQMPFINAEQQYEWRWTMDACMQISPVISTPQQFLDAIDVTLEPVDVLFPVS
jgi:hypothetical protein